MATARSYAQYRRIQARRIQKLKQGKRRGPITAAKYMASQLRMMAPRLTGNLIKSIVRRKSSVSVSGVSNNGFPYIHWINATPGTGLERIAYMKRWTGDETKYSYSQVQNRTGEPGFFWLAQKEARKFYRDAMIRNTRNALKAEF